MYPCISKRGLVGPSVRLSVRQSQSAIFAAIFGFGGLRMFLHYGEALRLVPKKSPLKKSFISHHGKGSLLTSLKTKKFQVKCSLF